MRLAGEVLSRAANGMELYHSSFPIFDRSVVTQRRTSINLTWAINPGVTTLHYFLVVSDPSWHAANREHHREHLNRYAESAHNDPAVKIDIRVQLPLDEVGI